MIIELSKGILMMGISAAGIIICTISLAVTGHVFRRKKTELLDEIKNGGE